MFRRLQKEIAGGSLRNRVLAGDQTRFDLTGTLSRHPRRGFASRYRSLSAEIERLRLSRKVLKLKPHRVE